MVWFLINPNHIPQHSGTIAVSDDPTDKTHDFGITGKNFSISFQMKGTTVYFETRVLTTWENENCCVIELTLDTPWNSGDEEVKISAATSSLVSIEQVIVTNRKCVPSREFHCALRYATEIVNVDRIFL